MTDDQAVSVPSEETGKSRPSRRLLLLTFLCAVLFFGGSGVLMFRHPTATHIHLNGAHGSELNVEVFPSCWLRRLTGLHCPGCGATRAYHYLLRGDFKTSLRYHPLVAPLFPVLLFLLIRFFYEAFTRREIRMAGYRYLACGALVMILLFWILRNIPGPAFDLFRFPTG